MRIVFMGTPDFAVPSLEVVSYTHLGEPGHFMAGLYRTFGLAGSYSCGWPVSSDCDIVCWPRGWLYVLGGRFLAGTGPAAK